MQPQSTIHHREGKDMKHGARNHLQGVVKAVKKGDKVRVVVKAVNVLLVKE